MSLCDAPPRVDSRAIGLLDDASREAARVWGDVRAAVEAGTPPMGLAAGDRPLADVEVLAGALASCEYLVAARMEAAAAAGCLPFGERGGLLAARGWSVSASRRLSRCAALAGRFASLTAAWSAGIITSEHIDPLARVADRFSDEELEAVVQGLEPHWGAWSPSAVGRFVAAAQRMLHPPSDPSPDEADAHGARSLAFSVLGDSVLIAGELPRVEGELVMAAIDALADRLRSTADHVPAGARRADALVQLVNDAHAAGALPTRGGLPVALTVTLDTTAAGDALWRTSRGHLLTQAEARWAACDAAVTPVLTSTGGCGEPAGLGFDLDPTQAAPGQPTPGLPTPGQPTAAGRIAALAATLFDTRIPLDVGRTQRTATAAQRRAVAVRDGGCIIPGCAVPAEACQVHHLQEWADGGSTDLANLASLCWAHHRQVDLGQWTIRPCPPAMRPPPQEPGAPPGTPWPGNRGAPFAIVRVPAAQRSSDSSSWRSYGVSW